MRLKGLDSSWAQGPPQVTRDLARQWLHSVGLLHLTPLVGNQAISQSGFPRVRRGRPGQDQWTLGAEPLAGTTCVWAWQSRTQHKQ